MIKTEGTFWSNEMHDCVIVLEEVDLVNSQLLSTHFFDEVLDDFVIGSLEVS